MLGIAVLVGGCGSGRTTLLQQLRERTGRTAAQLIDVERTATTPERFLRAVTSYADLEPELLGRVEELIDFVTVPGND